MGERHEEENGCVIPGLCPMSWIDYDALALNNNKQANKQTKQAKPPQTCIVDKDTNRLRWLKVQM